MLVYGEHKEYGATRLCLHLITLALKKIVQNHDLDSAVELLIECGIFETALADHYCIDKDELNPLLESASSLALRSAEVLCHVMESGRFPRESLAALHSAFQRVQSLDLPERSWHVVPEGFAFYGLYPECYIRSAENFFHDCRPEQITVIGLRSIGSTLSSVVEAKLRLLGADVLRFTVRPHGHPFDRKVKLGESLKELVKRRAGGYVLIIDEGPGLSGSSLCGTARTISKLGVPVDRIVLFPSWIPSGDSFVSESARTEWSMYSKYCTDFAEIRSGLDVFNRGKEYIDISSGKWRRFLFPHRWMLSAVNPYHERRKYAELDGDNISSVLKFAGLGRFGNRAEVISRILGERGFSPKVIKCVNGFIQYEYCDGDVFCEQDLGTDFFKSVTQYLIFRKSSLPVSGEVLPYESLLTMIKVNVAESFGEPFARSICFDGLMDEELYYNDISVVDGRMLPAKWIKTGGKWVKIDGADHHRDQFLPGPQNIAWDLAGVCIEFGLSDIQKRELLDLYKADLFDPYIEERIPFYLIAYSAFRTGYASMAAASLSGSEDGKLFAHLTDYYKRILEGELKRVQQVLH